MRLHGVLLHSVFRETRAARLGPILGAQLQLAQILTLATGALGITQCNE